MLDQMMRLRALLTAFAVATMLGGCANFDKLKPAVDFTIEAVPDGRHSFRLNFRIARSTEPDDAPATAPAAQPTQTE